MARLLLDENLPRQLAAHFTRHEARTVRDMQWTGTRNGHLLRRAAEHFDVLVTLDKGIPFQQAVQHLPLGVVLLRTRTNRFPDIAPFIAAIEAAADRADPGAVVELDLRSPR